MGESVFRSARFPARAVVALVGGAVLIAWATHSVVARGYRPAIISIVFFGTLELLTLAGAASPLTITLDSSGMTVRRIFRTSTFDWVTCHEFRRAPLGRTTVVVFRETHPRGRAWTLRGDRGRRLQANRFIPVPTTTSPDGLLTAIASYERRTVVG